MPEAEPPADTECRKQLALAPVSRIEQPDEHDERSDIEQCQLKRRVPERCKRASSERKPAPRPGLQRREPSMDAR